jgi:hypothetical protein
LVLREHAETKKKAERGESEQDVKF